jgi:acetyltransferase
VDVEGARAGLAACGEKLTEREAKAVLARYGLPVTKERLAASAEEAAACARDFGGALALKIESPDIAHTTEAGAIRLDVRGEPAAREAYEAVVAAAKRYAPQARINGVLVQEMAPKGVELIVGAVRDPVFGPVVVVGLGGIYVEVLKDVTYRAAPIGATDARAMLGELRSAKLLDGVRGMAPRDVEAIVVVRVRLSWFAHVFAGEVGAIALNPVVVLERGAGARIVDALLVRGG